MTHAHVFRLLPHEDKGALLAEAVAAAREGRTIASVIHEVDPTSFSQTPGSPFAYWVSERDRRIQMAQRQLLEELIGRRLMF